MARYIDADALREEVIEEISQNNLNNLFRYAFIDEDFVAMIDDSPTANVAEVRHGQWLPIEDDVIFKCSLCDCEVSTSWDYEEDDMFSYCPCCGARMDGEQG